MLIALAAATYPAVPAQCLPGFHCDTKTLMAEIESLFPGYSPLDQYLHIFLSA